MVPKMADLDMFIHISMVKVFSHPANITPVKIPFTFPVHEKNIITCLQIMSLEKREERGRWQWGGAKNCHRVQMITSRIDACKEFFESFLPNIISDTELHKTAGTKPITQQFWWCRWIDHVLQMPQSAQPRVALP